MTNFGDCNTSRKLYGATEFLKLHNLITSVVWSLPEAETFLKFEQKIEKDGEVISFGLLM